MEQQAKQLPASTSSAIEPNGESGEAQDIVAKFLAATPGQAIDIRNPIGIFASAEGRHAVALTSEDYPEALRAVSRRGPEHREGTQGPTLVGVLPAVYPEWLGTRRFTARHGCRFPYVVGAMARGITTARMVSASAEAGLLSFFGAAGLRPAEISDAIAEIKTTIAASSNPYAPWGSNLIHSPDRPEREREVVDLYLEQGVKRVSASAFMTLSPDIVRFSARGLSLGDDGEVKRDTHVFAKVSRPEVATHFMTPPPAEMLQELVAAGQITKLQADLQSKLPIAEDVTVEADSGGHTDNRPLSVIFPVIAGLRDRLMRENGYSRPIRLGAAGGLGTPQAVAAAFQLGADYVLTGSVNQSATEAGVSDEVRALLSECGLADVTMAPAADMFERGVKVQVLRKGTMFAVKAQRLYELYRRFDAIDAFPPRDREWLEKQVLGQSFADAWDAVRSYHQGSNPALAAKAEGDPKQQMALVFRRYLFMGAQWARDGAADRRMDYQIWCGPAMGAFNDWVRGSFLEAVDARTVGQIALNLLQGACISIRIHHLRMAGIDLSDPQAALTPTRLALD